MLRSLLGGLALVCVVALPIAPQESQFKDSPWHAIERGSMEGDLAFDVDGRLWLRTKASSLLLHTGWDSKLGQAEQILVSSPSHTGRYQLVIGDIYRDEPAYLLDRKERKLVNLPIHRYVHTTYAWSPDDSYLAVARQYEFSDQLFVVDLPSLLVREVRRKSLGAMDQQFCCGLSDWANEHEVGYYERDSVRWIDSRRFQFKLEIICNPYNEECDDAAFRREHGIVEKQYRITVDVQSGKILEELIKTIP